MTSSAPAILFEYARTFILPLFSAGRIIICIIPLNRRRTGTLSFSWLAGFPFPAPRNSPAPSTIILISSSAVTARQPFLSTADTFIDYLNAVRTARASAYSHNRYEARRNSSKNRFFIFRLYVARI